MTDAEGVLRVVAVDSAHMDPDFFEYPESLPHRADEKIWAVWEHTPGEDDGDEGTWTELASGLTVQEAENER